MSDFANERTTRRSSNTSLWRKLYQLCEIEGFVQMGSYTQSGPMFPLMAYIFPRITSYAVSQVQPFKSWSHLCDLPLDDLNPASQQPIHLLIDLYGSLWLDDLHQDPLGTPTYAQKMCHAKKTAICWSYLILQISLRAMRTKLRCGFAFPKATQIRCYVNFGKMRKLLRIYLLKKRTKNIRNISSLFILARQKIDTECDYLSRQLLQKR